MFPDNEDCRFSHRGERYARCEADRNVCVPESFLSHNMSEPRECRECEGQTEGLQWRCNDGSCIQDLLYRDGSPDCRDGSDHQPLLLHWYHLLVIALVFVLFFCIFLALVCQFDVNVKTGKDTEMAPLKKHKDVPIKLILDLEHLLNVKDIKELSQLERASFEERYKCVHQDPIQFFHLFMYLAHRCESLGKLKKIVQYLLYLEQGLHRSTTKAEALKCWRYHLGESAMSLKITSCVADQYDINYTVAEAFKIFGRSCFRTGFNTVCDIIEIIFPIAEGTFFYLERLKNLSYAYIIYVALSDLTRDNLVEETFGFSLFLTLAFQIGLVQIAHIFISAFHSQELLVKCCPEGGCKQWCWKKISIKIVSVVFFFLMPLLALAKFVCLQTKITRGRRKLVTAKTGREKVTIYQTFRGLEKQMLTYKKIYSYYRVTSAILESGTTAFFFDFLVFVTRRTGRYRPFIELLQKRFYSFYGVEPVTDTGEFFLPLNRTGYFIFYFSIAYSVLVLLTALLKYWENVKNLGLRFWSKVSLVGYLAFIILNDHWTSVSIYGATETFLESGSVTPLATGSIYFIYLGIRMLLIFYVRGDQEWFNKKTFPSFCSSRTGTKTEETDWTEGNSVEKVVNVIVNCLVATPFSVYKDPVDVLEKLKKQALESSDDEVRRKILLMWWQNPVKELSQRSVRFIKRELTKKEVNEEEKEIRDILIKLMKEEKVNTPLLKPVTFNRDFGGLCVIVLIKNIASIITELVTREVVVTGVHIGL